MAAGAAGITQVGFVLDYLEVRHAATLAPITSLKDGPMRMLVAAKLGSTRLIDNIAVQRGEACGCACIVPPARD